MKKHRALIGWQGTIQYRALSLGVSGVPRPTFIGTECEENKITTLERSYAFARTHMRKPPVGNHARTTCQAMRNPVRRTDFKCVDPNKAMWARVMLEGAAQSYMQRPSQISAWQ